MSAITNFFRRAKRKLLRDSIRVLRNCYYDDIFRDEAGKGDIMLNIGAGNWYCKDWTNLDYLNGTPKSYEDEFATMGMNEFLIYITEGLEYRKDFPGDHINDVRQSEGRTRKNWLLRNSPVKIQR